MTTSNLGPRPRRAIIALIVAGILLIADIGAVMALHHRHREQFGSLCLSDRNLRVDGDGPGIGPGTAGGRDDLGPATRGTIAFDEKCGAFGSRGMAQRKFGNQSGGGMFGTNNGNGATNVPNSGQNAGPNRRPGTGFPPLALPGSGSGNSTTTTTTTAPAGVGQ